MIKLFLVLLSCAFLASCTSVCVPLDEKWERKQAIFDFMDNPR